jgi:hypothetical protein
MGKPVVSLYRKSEISFQKGMQAFFDGLDVLQLDRALAAVGFGLAIRVSHGCLSAFLDTGKMPWSIAIERQIVPAGRDGRGGAAR